MVRSASIILSALLFACRGKASGIARAADSSRSCLRYGPETVTVHGRLERLVFPGRPNYEDTLQGDEPEAGFYLRVKRSICVAGGRDEELGGPHYGVDSVQLVLDSTGYATLRPYVGRDLALHGTLFPEYTGHHHAPVLLKVSTLVGGQ
jgi:uncharacterized protein DUF4431